jgi:metal-responsive CopG/Arc/MetJ family transcriptional regulator
MNTSLSFSEDLLLAVDRVAKEMGISRSDLFRKAMERYLEQQSALADEALEAAHEPSRHSKPMVVVRARHVPDDEDW